MKNQAQQIESSLKRVEEADLLRFGASVDASGVWTLRDGSRGRIPNRPIAVYSDTSMLGFSCFDAVEYVAPRSTQMEALVCQHEVTYPIFSDDGQPVGEYVCGICGVPV